ncbi:Profilin [Lamellibrachia satsuma]|nr:Profilin [Lamellibrachia satsuma]
MSWDPFRDNLVASGHVTKAALCGLDGSVWTQTPGMDLKQPEVVTLVNGLSDSSVLTANGIHLGGQKYIYLRSDDTQIQGRKGDGGCSIAKANTCLVIAIYGEGVHPGNCRSAVEKMRDYLMGQNY